MSPAEWETWKLLNARKPEDIAEYPDLERIDFDPALDQITAGGPIEQMPLVVLSADELYGPAMESQAANGELPASVPADFGHVIDRANKQAQEAIAQLVEGAEHITETNSGHNTMIDNAPLVINAIRDVLDAVRAERPTLASPVEAGTDLEETLDIGGGRTIYLECRGTGSPTVLLVSGTQGAGDEWTHVFEGADPTEPTPSDHAVLPEVAQFTRVCAYDRPGTTRFGGELVPSTPVRQPTTAEEGVSDLHALLAAADQPGPYVVVGASWGGLIAKLFASTYPDEVSGLVLVDGASEIVKETFTPGQWNGWMEKVDESLAAAPGLETPSYEPSVEALAAAPVPSVPAVVLTAEKPWDLNVGNDGSTWPAWLEAQDLLAAQLGAEHVTNTNSGHAIGVEQPALVVDAIRTVVDTARNGNRHTRISWSAPARAPRDQPSTPKSCLTDDPASSKLTGQLPCHGRATQGST
jgi:pimeloyl-ACP methyl ester carboxylesterase